MQQKESLSAQSDEMLMQLIANGKVAAFDELYCRYSPLMMRYYTRMLNYDRDLAEDAMQDLFLKIAQSPGAFNPQRSFKTWIYSVASNSCKNFYRHRQIVQEHQNSIKDHTYIPDGEFLSLASKIDVREFRKMLEEILNELPVEKKEAFILKYVEDRSISEIAEIQDCPEGSVKSRIFYTVKILQDRLRIFKPVND